MFACLCVCVCVSVCVCLCAEAPTFDTSSSYTLCVHQQAGVSADELKKLGFVRLLDFTLLFLVVSPPSLHRCLLQSLSRTHTHNTHTHTLLFSLLPFVSCVIVLPLRRHLAMPGVQVPLLEVLVQVVNPSKRAYCRVLLLAVCCHGCTQRSKLLRLVVVAVAWSSTPLSVYTSQSYG